mgnify:CR=1 FL=1
MRTTLLALVGIVVLLGGVFFYAREEHSAEMEEPPTNQELKTYRSETTGISFRYPSAYFLEEKDLSSGKHTRYAIILTEDTEENRQVREGTAPPREGPTAITIDIFQNNLDNYTTENWIRGTNDSNFKLSPDGTLTSVIVGDESGLYYRWSGLYEGETVAVARPRFVYALSATYLNPEDQIRRDFEEITKTLRFTDNTPELE